MPNLKRVSSKRKVLHQSKDSFYANQPWRKLRAKKLRINPLCEICEKQGIYKEAHSVDHYYPRRLWPEHQLRLENLTSMCAEHHGQKSRIETDILDKAHWLARFKDHKLFSKK